jgi:hypothetical protein
MATSETKDGESFLEAYWLYLVAGAVLLGSLAGLYFYPERGPWHGVIEAICIASALTLTVDPFVKERLAHEVNKSIFYHVIGFDLPPAMQDRLRTYLRALEYYRESLEITAEALRMEDEEVVIEITLAGKVVALTRCRYAPSLEFEAPEQGEVKELWARRTGETKNLVEWKAGGTTAVSDPLTVLYAATEATLKRGETLDSYFRFTLRQRKQDYWVQTFGTTTLRTTVTLKPLPGMKMYASHKELRGDHHYEYDRVFVMGEDVRIRWQVEAGAGGGKG